MAKAESVRVAAEREAYHGYAEVESDEQDGLLDPGHLQAPDELERESEQTEFGDDVEGCEDLPADGLGGSESVSRFMFVIRETFLAYL